MATVYLGLGSNVGDREEYIERALESLRASQVHVARVSCLYETTPVGYNKQRDFLNLVAECETEISPGELVAKVKEIERAVGRTETFRFGPREIDIDILLYGDAEVHQPGLDIPHREMVNRAFVLVPFAEIAPNVVHPTERRTIAELASQLRDSSGVRRLDRR